MKIYVLMENSPSDGNFQAEHGLSLYVETQNHRLLSDTGQSALTWDNAAELGVGLKSVDSVVISQMIRGYESGDECTNRAKGERKTHRGQ